ncbi:TPA: hypothetical protein N2G33_000835 [Salmonella enterica]|nr:hypothetical protein [Salmonella enterica]
MNKALLVMPFLLVGCATAGEKPMATLSMLQDDMMLSKVVGICSTYEKLFTFAKSTNDQRDIEFVKKFLAFSAREAGYTTEKMVSVCDNAFETHRKVTAVINEYK